MSTPSPSSADVPARGVGRYVRPRFRVSAPKGPRKHGGGLSKGQKVGSIRHPDLELRLEIFLMVREILFKEDKVPLNRPYTQEEIADACEVSRGSIYRLEKRAMEKMRVRANKLIELGQDEFTD